MNKWINKYLIFEIYISLTTLIPRANFWFFHSFISHHIYHLIILSHLSSLISHLQSMYLSSSQLSMPSSTPLSIPSPSSSLITAPSPQPTNDLPPPPKPSHVLSVSLLPSSPKTTGYSPLYCGRVRLRRAWVTSLSGGISKWFGGLVILGNFRRLGRGGDFDNAKDQVKGLWNGELG